MNEEIELKLRKVQAYGVYSADNETSSSWKGMYRKYAHAVVASKGAGWYNRDGEVKTVTCWQDEKSNLYSLQPIGKYTDDDLEKRKAIMNSIYAKLSAEEMELLGIEQKEPKDMLEEKCAECDGGIYKETKPLDDLTGVLHCDVCGHETRRHV